MSILIDKLLQACVKQGASDIHIVVGQPPVFRLHGRMRKLETKVLEPDDSVALMKSIAPERSEIAGTVHTALGLVLSGYGVAIVPESSAGLRLRGIVFRHFTAPEARVPLVVCCRHADPSKLAAAFIRHVRQTSHPWPVHEGR